ncbi:MAG: hypothetical protein PHH16_03140 [Candidatus Gracilibacteria bacterium]|nr:hypothetical protein [Candidatus Gracilibacteria bacterium]
MVKKWKKQIEKINSSGKIDIGKIVEDLIDGKTSTYDISPLEGKKNIFRLKTSKYRIVFEKGAEIKILKIDKRGDVYKGL